LTYLISAFLPAIQLIAARDIADVLAEHLAGRGIQAEGWGCASQQYPTSARNSWQCNRLSSDEAFRPTQPYHSHRVQREITTITNRKNAQTGHAQLSRPPPCSLAQRSSYPSRCWYPTFSVRPRDSSQKTRRLYPQPCPVQSRQGWNEIIA
jgi:hypothetical protein